MMAADMTIPEFTPMTSRTTRLTPPVEGSDLLLWLAGSEAEGGARRDAGLKWLLATTFSEVVWGRRDGDAWRLSNEAATLPAATLPAATLLELRAFGDDGEVFVWREAAGLRARLRRDAAAGANAAGDDTFDTYEEEQLMWGTVRLEGAPDRFTRLAEGDQGLVHAPPLALDESCFITDPGDERFGHRPARLVLRHYVGRDEETGLARVVDSRLVDVRPAVPAE